MCCCHLTRPFLLPLLLLPPQCPMCREGILAVLAINTANL